MTNIEIQEVIDLGDLPIPINSFSQTSSGVPCINNYIPLNVIKVNQSYDKNVIIDLKFNNVTEGYLFFVRHKRKIEIDSMTEFEFIAFMQEAEFEDYSYSSYEFKYDYVLIKETFFNAYKLDYEKTSALWGGFSHNLGSTEPINNYTNNIFEIEAGIKLKELDNYSYESTIRAIEQPYAFERFLKLYHLLELQFDYFLIDKIKNLQIPADSNKIGTLLNGYSRNELDRLTEIIRSHCTDINPLVENLELVFSFKPVAEDMFIKFGNNNKPLSDFTKFNEVFNLNSFSSTSLLASKVINNQNPHSEFIPKLVAYWIYRIRCSVAHNKIGEYLLSWNDENFIVEFAEPLLKEVLKQCFKK